MQIVTRFATTVLLAAACSAALASDPVSVVPQTASPGAEQTQQEVSAEIQAIRARINQLESQQKSAARVADENKTRQVVLEDVTRHGQALDVGQFSAGYKDGRLYLGSEDGNFLLRPFLHTQIRDVTVQRQNFKPGGDDDIQNGFEIRRMRFGFDGYAFTPDLSYWFNWGTQRASGSSNVNNAAGTKIGTVSNSLGGNLLLEEAWVKYRINSGDFYLRGGQMRDPLLHDEIIGTVRQQGVERPVASDIFVNGEGFTEAATLIYDPKTWLRTEAGVNHGLRSANTNFLDYPNSNAFNFGAVARAEFKVMGNWKDYAQIGAVDVKDPLLVIGVGADYSERGHSGQTVGVVDIMYAAPSGLSIYGSFIDRYTNHNFGIYQPTITGANIAAPPASVLNRSTNEYAAVIQAGYLFGKHWEPYGRFEYIHVAGTAAGSKNYIPVIAGGVNYYFFGHKCKMSAQLEYLPKGIPFDDTPNDLLASPSGKSEFSGTVQFQLFL